jgi:hypothetical protein
MYVRSKGWTAVNPKPTFVSLPTDRWVYREAVIRTTRLSQRYPLRHIPIFDLYPAAKERSERMPHGKTLLGRNCKYLICALIQGNIVSDERKQPGVHRQA